ncbi:hypothetical protein U1Q18_006564 [Sarracenia purpurea var. burkii]
MAPHGEAITGSFSRSTGALKKLPRLSTDGLHRTVSDISFQLGKEAMADVQLPPISEVEEAKCECCGMAEECTPEYIERVRNKFFGKWVCGLCAEAVNEEVEKNGGKREEALSAHMSACVRFNKLGRAYPVLCQAAAMREILKKSARMGGRTARAKSISPREQGGGAGAKTSGISRSSSCIPAITREMTDLTKDN